MQNTADKTARSLSRTPKNTRVVFTFGRFQPPHIGHALLINNVLRLAKELKADHYVVISASCNEDGNNGKKKKWIGTPAYTKQRTERTFTSCAKNENPLKIDRKLHYLQRMFPTVRFLCADEFGSNMFAVLGHLKDAGYTQFTGAFGSDRAVEMTKTFARVDATAAADRKLGINVVSIGERDDKADDVTGASATKMREAAVRGEPEDVKYFIEHSKIGDMTLEEALTMMQEIRDSLWPSESKAGGGAARLQRTAIKHKPRPKSYRLRADEKPLRSKRS